MVPRNRAAVLAFGSLFNCAVDPLALPLVRTRVFERAERAVGTPAEHYESATEDYRHHLAFERETEDRLRAEGVPVRDALDVQSLLFLASFPEDAAPEVEESWE